jgi:uncharacterized membrane protein
VTHSPADERTIHRYEAFSDVVIGFSLAEIGATLVAPKPGQRLFDDPTWLIAFVIVFSVICTLWFFHHRLFTIIFVPRTVPIILNFAWLGVVVLCAYSAQLVVRIPEDIGVWRLYFSLFVLAYGILAAQYYIGLHQLAGSLTTEVIGKARRQLAFMTLWTLPFILCATFAFTLPVAEMHLPVGLTFMATAVASGLLGRYYRKRDGARPGVEAVTRGEG